MGAVRKSAPADLLRVWDEFGNAEELRGSQGQRHAQRHPAGRSVPAGSLAAQQWLAALARHCEGAAGAQAKAHLAELLRCGSRSKDKVVEVANRARLQISKVFSWTHHVDDPPGYNNPARARECHYLFERVLHAVLLEVRENSSKDSAEAAGVATAAAGNGGGGGGALAAGTSSTHNRGSPGRNLTAAAAEADRSVEAVLCEAEYQLGLVNACVEVVVFAHMQLPEQAFPWATLQLGRLHSTLELWQAIDWVCETMTEPPPGAEGCVPGIPEEVVEYLSTIQVRVEEELAFIDSSSIYKHIVATSTTWPPGGSGGGDGVGGDSEAPEPGCDSHTQQCHGSGGGGGRRQGRPVARPGPNAVLMARFLSNLARTIMMRTYSVAHVMLEEYPELQRACPELPSRVCVVMDVAMTKHLELLFGQHASVLIACSIYLTLRLHGESLAFRKITALMVAALPNHDEHTFARVELPPQDGTSWDGSRDHGDTRAFYNRVFLPVFADYEASQLFGDGMAPTPAKCQLEAPEPASEAPAGAADAGHLVGRSAAAPGAGAPGGDAAKHALQATAAAAAAAASLQGAKDLRRLRRPLGQVTNRGPGRSGLRPC